MFFTSEPATQTLRGLFETLNGFVEESVTWLGGVWSDFRAEVRPVPPSPARWVFTPPADVGFVGIAPTRRDDLAAGVVHPRTAERIALAMKVRAL